MLQRFPAEIQLLIIQNLEIGNLSRLALTSQHFYTLANPLLYQDIDNDVRDLDRLVDTLGRNSSLREYPRSLKLEAWYPVSAEEAGTVWHVDDDLLIDSEKEDPDYHPYRVGLLCQLAKATSPSPEEGETWAREIRADNQDAWVALLLILSPRLTRLEVQFPATGRWVHRVIEWSIHRQYTGETFPLQHVQEVYVTARWFEFQGEIQDVTRWALMFLRLPALRRLATDALSGHEYETTITHPSSATHIRIDQCKGLRYLDRLVINCPKLESYRHDYFPQSPRRHILDPRNYYPALLHARYTLKRLWLDIFPNLVIENEDGVHWPSFDEFAVLELLHVPVFLLGDYKNNPPELAPILSSSLTALHVIHVEKWSLSTLLASLVDYIFTVHQCKYIGHFFSIYPFCQ